MRIQRKLGLLLLILTLLALYSFAADRKQLSDALAAVNANLKTLAGKQYDADLSKVFMEKYAASLHPCRQSEPGKPKDFDMFLKLHTDGKVDQVLIYPETPFAKCAAGVLQDAKFAPPPHGDYWLNIHMQFSK